MASSRRTRPFWYLRRRSDAISSEVDEELQLHLQLRTRDLIGRGLSADAARRQALDEFGDIETTRRYCVDQDRDKENHMHRRLILGEVGHDLRIACRSLAHVPIMTITIVLTVGVGIGATAAIFGALDTALLRPLPYADPDRLVRIYTDSPPNKFPFSVVDYQALTAQQTRFEQIAGYSGRSMAFTDKGVAVRLRAKVVSWSYFGLLGLRPSLGRSFVEADGTPGSPPAVIVSDGFWKQRLNGVPDAVGQPIRLDGTNYTLVGVLGPGVGPLEQDVDLFVAAQWEPPTRKGPFFITVLGRLPRGADRTAAADELHAINRRIFPIWRASYQDHATWSFMNLKTAVVGDVSNVAGLALTAVALVWLIACANASNLLVARIASRRRELAVRAALGASRRRVVRYLLGESVVLAVGAAIVGVAVAWSGVALLRTVGADYFPRMQELTFDRTVLLMVAAATAAGALLFGFVPALHGTGGDLDEALRASSRSATGSLGVRTIRRLLVGAQFAIATPLLVVAGLLLVSLNELGRVDVGFNTHNMLTGSLALPHSTYHDEGGVIAFWDTLRLRIAAIPGVSGVAFADGRPPNEVSNDNNFELEDAPTRPGTSQPVTPWVSVTPDYFRVIGLNLVEGRLLDDQDVLAHDLDAIVVDRAWASRFFPGRSAVGKRLKQGGCTTCPWTTVVGVVTDVKYAGLDKPDQGTVYWAMSRATPFRYVMVRTTTSANALAPALRQVVNGLDPDVPLANVATVDDLIDRALQRPSSLSFLLTAIAIVALLLSVVGIYGVMAYYVQQHSKEIAIRRALGGNAASVLRLVVGQGLAIVSGGVVIGIAVAAVIARLIANLLFGVSPADPRTLAIVVSMLLTIAFFACVLPARRVIRLEPAAALRDE